jgi:hypothetical protein
MVDRQQNLAKCGIVRIDDVQTPNDTREKINHNFANIWKHVCNLGKQTCIMGRNNIIAYSPNMCVNPGNKNASWIRTSTLHTHQTCVQILKNKHASWVK